MGVEGYEEPSGEILPASVYFRAEELFVMLLGCVVQLQVYLLEFGIAYFPLQQPLPKLPCIFGVGECEELVAVLFGREEGRKGIRVIVDEFPKFLQAFFGLSVEVEGEYRVVADDFGW